MRHTDPRLELLSILGVLAALAGAAMSMAVPLLARSSRAGVTPAFVATLATIALTLVVAGVALAFRRRAGGVIVAGISLAAAAGYLYMLVVGDCAGCSAAVIAANVIFLLVTAAPGAVILRWRRFLR